MYELDHFALLSGLLGGLAIFLFGMDLMTKALKIIAGSRMKDFLNSVTKNRFVGVVTGAVVTGIINSSSVTTVILVGFISAGLITTAQSVSVIMGANIGSTMTAQILAFKVTSAAMPMITIGFFISLLAKKEKISEYGNMLLGFGLVFYGMSIMSDSMSPLRSYEPFMQAMRSIDNRVYGILIGAIFTAIIQSSAATTGIIIAMAGQGLLVLPLAIAITLGANIGTCATAGLAVIGKTREAVRTAVVHTAFNVIGVLIWVWFIPQFVDLIISISPMSSHLSGKEKLMADTPRQIANAHTIFNVVNTLIFIWFTPQFAKFATWLIPEKRTEKNEKPKPLYIADEILDIPDIAIARCRMEIAELGMSVRKMYENIMPAIISGDKEDLAKIEKMDERVDIIHGYTIEFLSKLVSKSQIEEQSDEILELIQITNHFESMGDIIETGLTTVGRRRLAEGVVVSKQTRELLEKYHGQTMVALDRIIVAVRDKNLNVAQEVNEMKKGMKRLTASAARHEAMRLTADAPNRLQTYTREMEMIENLSQIYKLCRRVSKAMLDRTAMLEASDDYNNKKSPKIDSSNDDYVPEPA